MDKPETWLARARADWWEGAGKWMGLAFLFSPPIITALLVFALGQDDAEGRRQMIIALQALLWAMAALGTTCLLLFIWNFGAAPFRIQRDRAKKAENQNLINRDEILALSKRNEVLSDNSAKLSIKFGQNIFGGIMDNSESTCVCSWFTVVNSGARPSSALNWHGHLISEGNYIELNPVAGNGLRLGSKEEENVMILIDENAIFEKTARPIEGGGQATGYFFAEVPGFWREYLSNAVLTIKCEQVDGRVVESSCDLGGGPSLKSPNYMPGVTGWNPKNGKK